MSSNGVPQFSMIQPAIMVGIGEILWDLLPSGSELGGAPANFAYVANVLGDKGVVASRTGADELGHDARSTMQELGLNPFYLQEDLQHSTGTVSVLVDSAGQPEFAIKDDVSWDYLEWTPSWADLAARANVICFGSMAQRSRMSRVTIRRFLDESSEKTLRIYDVNLRKPFYSREIIEESLKLCHVAKVNADELVKVCDLLGIGGHNEETRARGLLLEFRLKLVCVTRGVAGSLLMTNREVVKHGGFRVKVADAVGAGDAFTACLAHHYVRGEPLNRISEFANRFAAWVTTQRGATPTVPDVGLQQILEGIA
jgi:fructokinase